MQTRSHLLGHEVSLALAGVGVTVLPFHRKWIGSVFHGDIQIGALSCPRGTAKTWIAGHLAGLAIRPGSPTFEAGIEVLAVSASLEQSRIILGFVREHLADIEGEYRWLDSSQRLTVTHKATRTRLRVLSSSGKRAMGLSQFSTIFADEPGSWESRGGAVMWDALRQSLGKREGQRLLLIGTRSPAEDGSWWPSLLDAGSGPGTHVTVLTAPDEEPWDSWQTIRKVNPLVMHSPSLRKTLLRERDDARRNDTLRPSFEAYRLNRQVNVHADELITIADWKGVLKRPVPEREGDPYVGLDLGGERSWSAAWCLWPNGRSEVYVLLPGLPHLADRENADAVPVGTYERLIEAGTLLIDEGLRVARPAVLVEHLADMNIDPGAIICDRFLLNTLTDAVGGRCPILPRRTRWSEATEDIAAFRQLAKDGPLSVVAEGRALTTMSMGAACVASDDQGSARLTKRRGNRSRDDLAVAGTLAAGALVRQMNAPPSEFYWAASG